MIFWSAGNQLTRVPKGRKQQFQCGRCHQLATFYECESDDSVKAFFVVELWKRSKRVMQCGECLGVCDYYTLFPDEKKADEEAAIKAEAERKAREQKAAAEDQAKAEKELARQEEIANKAREAERARKDKQLDDELEKLKKKMGQ